MPELSGLLLVTVVLALLFDFSNGWHDCANAVATVVSTRVLRPLTAVLLAGALNIAGAFFSTAVAKMIGGGIVFPDAITNVVVAGAMAGAICWNLFTLILGLPTSSSHALIGGLVGAAVAHGGWAVVQFKGLNKILEAMVLSPLLGFGMGFLIMALVSWSFFRVHRGVATKLFSRLQLVSASFMAFSHGANDAQKVMGVITLALVASGQLTSSEVPTWVIVSCALAMGLGTTVGGWRIIHTLGMKMVKLEPVHGFAAETGAATVLLFTAQFGLPVSTTHTITSSILGVGSTKRLSAVRWGVTTKILSAWIFTLPGAALLGAGAYTVLSWFH
ncbi:putative low-affinity inorganic phosphate transporter [Candidatus Nitrospira nitrosa]|uniref:Putative low-affinity inorganic phosphate transporter n=1 Tax=Candidatus Nitrospira nitrosa TaxID=1742972 RepID=A0A0S4L4R1_9BACT|nr:inorganic phosphate transporter [Candidatus Nitrospira nitrosa]CUS31769.1 putative low-affinity inorganic phosphate transporter [Candidatus Nitrospira nitrosa]